MTGPEARKFLQDYAQMHGLGIGTRGMSDDTCIAIARLVKAADEQAQRLNRLDADLARFREGDE